MKSNELPPSHRVALTDDRYEICEALTGILGALEWFTHSQPILGEPCSVRLLSLGQPAEAAAHCEVLAPVRAALEITKLTSEARYDPPEVPGAKKGWEIRGASMLGRPIAIVRACWILS